MKVVIKHNQGNIGCDCGKGEICFLSHAHKDHLNGVKRKKRFIAHPSTLDLANINADLVRLDNCKMFEAGHILGSKQLYVENGKVVLYTGDMRYRESLFFKPAEPVHADVLLLDCTYAIKGLRFPPLEEVYENIRKWIRQMEGCNLLFGAYRLGKAQEIVRLLNEEGLSPLVDAETAHYCEIYNKHGIKLDYVVIGSEEGNEMLKHGFAAIVPMQKAKRYYAKALEFAYGKKTRCAVLTGWAMIRHYDCHASFPLSDHSDFYELLEFVKDVDPKVVVPLHCSKDQASEIRSVLEFLGYRTKNWNEINDIL